MIYLPNNICLVLYDRSCLVGHNLVLLFVIFPYTCRDLLESVDRIIYEVSVQWSDAVTQVFTLHRSRNVGLYGVWLAVTSKLHTSRYMWVEFQQLASIILIIIKIHLPLILALAPLWNLWCCVYCSVKNLHVCMLFLFVTKFKCKLQVFCFMLIY